MESIDTISIQEKAETLGIEGKIEIDNEVISNQDLYRIGDF